jgi:hypothetical protein
MGVPSKLMGGIDARGSASDGRASMNTLSPGAIKSIRRETARVSPDGLRIAQTGSPRVACLPSLPVPGSGRQGGAGLPGKPGDDFHVISRQNRFEHLWKNALVISNSNDARKARTK